MYSFQSLNSLVSCEFTRNRVCFLVSEFGKNSSSMVLVSMEKQQKDTPPTSRLLQCSFMECLQHYKKPCCKEAVPINSQVTPLSYLPVSGSQSELSDPSPIQLRKAQAGGQDTAAASCSLWAAGLGTGPSHVQDLEWKVNMSPQKEAQQFKDKIKQVPDFFKKRITKFIKTKFK